MKSIFQMISIFLLTIASCKTVALMGSPPQGCSWVTYNASYEWSLTAEYQVCAPGEKSSLEVSKRSVLNVAVPLQGKFGYKCNKCSKPEEKDCCKSGGGEWQVTSSDRHTLECYRTGECCLIIKGGNYGCK